HYRGKELNSPNDVVVAEDGSIYFTDPPYGRTDGPGADRERELDFQGVYRIAPGAAGEPQLLVAEDEFERPNGLCLSPDGATLYVDDTARGEVKAFAVAADGSLGGARVVASGIGPDPRRGSPDGIKCDALGNLWVTGPGGVWVVSPSGEHLGTVLVPEKAANLNWGGPGWNQLYVTASTSLYRIRTRIPGSPASYMRLG
ncbi:MAG: SMP-30/gluconolactonase/LRE family protein, partial [Candidatus Dormibacteraceae bacterium]